MFRDADDRFDDAVVLQYRAGHRFRGFELCSLLGRPEALQRRFPADLGFEHYLFDLAVSAKVIKSLRREAFSYQKEYLFISSRIRAESFLAPCSFK